VLARIRKYWEVPELRKRFKFTMWALLACRIGAFIPVPGVSREAAVAFIGYATGGSQNILQLVDKFTGGAFAQMAIFGVGIMPYITASIVLQMGMVLFPGLQREMRENPQVGRRKMNKLTRVLTLVLGLGYSLSFAKYVVGFNAARPGVVLESLLQSQLFGMPWLFYLTTMICMTTGTMILMWIGDQITDRGIGNGTSLIIGLGIVASLPGTVGTMIRQLNLESQEIGELTFSSMVVLIGAFVAIVTGAILIIQGQRRVPLQYARRVVGRSEVQGGGSHLPLKVNYAGVIPVIMASTFLMLPATVAQMVGQSGWLATVARSLSPGSSAYSIIFVLLIFFFTYFWTGVTFHPGQIAAEMQRNGAFIPGIRQGGPTESFISGTMTRVTFLGALSLAFVAILPTLVARVMGVDAAISQFFGGTSLLIIVGVVLDTLKQVDGHMVMQRYDGLVRGSLRSR